jgi:hypothetical protein
MSTRGFEKWAQKQIHGVLNPKISLIQQELEDFE